MRRAIDANSDKCSNDDDEKQRAGVTSVAMNEKTASDESRNDDTTKSSGNERAVTLGMDGASKQKPVEATRPSTR